jgi:hypothetical protein
VHRKDFLRVEIPACVTKISYNAFGGCYRLTEVVNRSSDFTVVKGDGNGNGSVGYYALAVYNGAGEFPTKIVEKEGWIFFDEGEKKTVVGYTGTAKELVISGEATAIKSYAFYGCDLTGLTVGSNILTVGKRAFYACAALEKVEIHAQTVRENAFSLCKNLREVIVYNEVKELGNDCFSACSSLQSVTLGVGLEWLNAYCFYNCTALTEIKFSGLKEAWGQIRKGNLWNYLVPATQVICADGAVDL